ncbi:hypothetical protein ACVW1A_002604 [Bradyrhizobium sp. LB1.3]
MTAMKERPNKQATAEDRGEQGVDDGRLELDESLVVQHQGQRAEHQHDDTCHDRHDRDVPRHHIGGDHRNDDRDHEGAGRGEQIELRIHEEEYE